jgi:hypothetical protein
MSGASPFTPVSLSFTKVKWGRTKQRFFPGKQNFFSEGNSPKRAIGLSDFMRWQIGKNVVDRVIESSKFLIRQLIMSLYLRKVFS